MLQRSIASGGFWHVVAGAVEEDESSDDAAVRELMEEVGLGIGRLEPASRTAFAYALAAGAHTGELQDVAVE
ncbi:MAG: NUDIX hydrolase [Gaiellaceae bacterium]